MLAVSPPRDAIKDEKQVEMDSIGCGVGGGGEFPDFGDANLLDAIDFDDLFIGIGISDYSDVLAEFSSDYSDGVAGKEESTNANENNCKASGDESVSSRKREERPPANPAPTTGNKEGKKSSSAQSKNNSQGNNKRKVKVDWTPELHRRFVQAVEGLGVDKAVPSRILEIMGIDCLTRHNIASHLQKYRSHRKHLMAREAEAASWSQRSQMYGAAKRELIPWTTTSAAAAVAGGVPTMGYPPMTTPPPPPPPMHHHHHFRPLHVWGHPSVDQSLMHMWPPKAPPPTTWPPPPRDHPSPYWHPPHHQVRVPNVLTPGTPCFPQPLASAAAPPRFGSTVVAVLAPVASAATVLDILPSKESIDAAIGDVLAKPWLPLPLGLKPPSTDSVMGELQRQGVQNVPPSCA